MSKKQHHLIPDPPRLQKDPASSDEIAAMASSVMRAWKPESDEVRAKLLGWTAWAIAIMALPEDQLKPKDKKRFIEALEFSQQHGKPLIPVRGQSTFFSISGNRNTQHSLLDMAARQDHAWVIEPFQKAGANLDKITSGKATPLTLAAINNSTKTALELLRLGANPNKRIDKWDALPLFAAAAHNNIKLLNALKTANADLEARAHSHGNALHYAIRQRNTVNLGSSMPGNADNAVAWVLKHCEGSNNGSILFSKGDGNNSDSTPLYLNCIQEPSPNPEIRERNYRITEWLLDELAKTDTKRARSEEMRGLLAAAEKFDVRRMHIFFDKLPHMKEEAKLLQNAAEVIWSASPKNDRHRSSVNSNIEGFHKIRQCLDLLMELGVDPHTPLFEGQYSYQPNWLYAAAQLGDNSLINYLLERGVDPFVLHDDETILDAFNASIPPESLEKRAEFQYSKNTLTSLMRERLEAITPKQRDEVITLRPADIRIIETFCEEGLQAWLAAPYWRIPTHARQVANAMEGLSENWQRDHLHLLTLFQQRANRSVAAPDAEHSRWGSRI